MSFTSGYKRQCPTNESVPYDYGNEVRDTYFVPQVHCVFDVPTRVPVIQGPHSTNQRLMNNAYTVRFGLTEIQTFRLPTSGTGHNNNQQPISERIIFLITQSGLQSGGCLTIINDNGRSIAYDF